MKYIILKWMPDRGWHQRFSFVDLRTREEALEFLEKVRTDNPGSAWRAAELLE